MYPILTSSLFFFEHPILNKKDEVIPEAIIAFVENLINSLKFYRQSLIRFLISV